MKTHAVKDNVNTITKIKSDIRLFGGSGSFYYSQQADIREILTGVNRENCNRLFRKKTFRPINTCTSRDNPEDEKHTLQAKTSSSQSGQPLSSIKSDIRSPGNNGRKLNNADKDFFENRFGYDFSEVRVHDGPVANDLASSINARAYTSGNNVVFKSGEYNNDSAKGKKLLAHELTHIIQQGESHKKKTNDKDISILSNPENKVINRKWVIDHPNAEHPPGGMNNAQLLLGAFREICPRVNLNPVSSTIKRLEVGPGTVPANRSHGCGCLQVIENDVVEMEAGRTSYLRTYPHIEAVPNGWSSTNPMPTSPKVDVRHPVDPFSWGYWTPGDTREIKEFYRTVAHEVCGHMAASVQGVASGRYTGTRGHNEAIIRENRIAGEHGIPASRQRGLDVSEGGVTAGRHRGESFLRAFTHFNHRSSLPRGNLNNTIQSAIGTIQYFTRGGRPDRLRIQLEGFAYQNEGGITLAMRRVQAVKQRFIQLLQRRRIPLNFIPPRSTTSVSRFGNDITTVYTRGRSISNRRDNNRRVNIYLYHRSFSAGP